MSSEESLKILKAVKQIGPQLGIPEDRFRRVLWGKFPSDRCGFSLGSVILGRQMMGKLEPEKWKPLMASTLIYKKTRHSGLLPTALKVVGIYLLIFWIGIIIIA